MTDHQKSFALVCRTTAFVLISICCAVYALFGAGFAKRYLEVPGLGWPLFVGEILFLAAGALFLAAGTGSRIPRKYQIAAGVFLAWIVALALMGYRETQLLSFRHAAIFYYSFFALMVYSVFQKDFFKGWKGYVSAGVLILLLLSRSLQEFYLLTCFSLLAVLLSQWMSWGRAGLVVAVVFLLSDPVRFFQGARTQLVATGLVCGVLLFIWAWAEIRIRRYWRVGIMLCLFGAGVWWGLRQVNQETLKTMTNYNLILNSFYRARHEAELKAAGYTPSEIPVRFYNQAYKLWPSVDDGSFDPLEEASGIVPAHPAQSGSSVGASSGVSAPGASPAVQESLPRSRANMLFRLFIWADMMTELKENNHWVFGFGFGKALRSKTIEVLNWADSEWKRDGWIEPHNSYLHVIYRTGVFGVFLVVLLFALVAWLAGSFIRRWSWQGILLSGALLYWLVAANFILVMELPYYAIPFWSLLGITMGYRRSLDEVNQAKG